MEKDVVFPGNNTFDAYFKDFYINQNDYNNLKNIPSLNDQPIIGDLDAIDYGFGTIYTYDVGNDPGTVPVIGQDGKLNSSIIPNIDITNYIAMASVNGNILTVINSDGLSFSSGDTTYNNATTIVAGLMSSTDKTKLDGIQLGAEVNVKSDWNQSNIDADDYIKNKPYIISTLTDLINLGAQSSTDNSLTTTNKTVTGSINELHSTIGTLNDSLEATLNGV